MQPGEKKTQTHTNELGEKKRKTPLRNTSNLEIQFIFLFLFCQS